MSALAEYANKYKTVRMERRNGVLQVTLHTDGGSLHSGISAARRAARGVPRHRRPTARTGSSCSPGPATSTRAACDPRDIIVPDAAADRANRSHPPGGPAPPDEPPEHRGSRHQRDQRSGVAALGDSTAVRHRARRRDRAVPGFGAFRLGRRAGRRDAYRVSTPPRHEPRALFSADRSRRWTRPRRCDSGLVAEVLPIDKLLARAWQLAEDLARKPTLLLRYTRLLFTEYLRRQMHDLLGYGLAMESLALFEKPE